MVSVCCLNCGRYFGEPGSGNFCSKECERAFIENLKNEVAEYEKNSASDDE